MIYTMGTPQMVPFPSLKRPQPKRARGLVRVGSSNMQTPQPSGQPVSSGRRGARPLYIELVIHCGCCCCCCNVSQETLRTVAGQGCLKKLVQTSWLTPGRCLLHAFAWCIQSQWLQCTHFSPVDRQEPST